MQGSERAASFFPPREEGQGAGSAPPARPGSPIGQSGGAPADAHVLPTLAPRPAFSRETFFRSFVYAWHGVLYALRTQQNARVHLGISVCAIALGIVLRISPVEFAMIFVAITGVFIGEMFNTVAEACVDLATQEYHPLARIAKDVAAGAVLLNALLSIVIGIFVFVPHLWLLALHLLAHR